MEKALTAANKLRHNQDDNMQEVIERVRQAERQSNRWHLKYNQLKQDLKETKGVILLYENLLDKLTEQNMKLKDWIKTKKVQDKEKKYTQALNIAEIQEPLDMPSLGTQYYERYSMPISLN